MTELLVHLGLASSGLLIAAGAAACVLRWHRGGPVIAHRLLRALLFAALAAPFAQFGVELLGERLGWAGVPTTIAPRVALDPRPLPVPATSATPGRITEPSIEQLASALALEPFLAPVPTFSLPEPRWTASVPASASSLPSPLALLGLIFAIGFCLRALRSLRRLGGTWLLFRRARPVRDPSLLAVWGKLSARSALARRTRLLEVRGLLRPACFGLRGAAIFLPREREMLPPAALACVLEHELVHLERRDTHTLLAEELFACLFWFHPAAWWLVRELDSLRELSCDWLVVRRTGGRKRYANALIEVASAAERSGEKLAAVLPWNDSATLLRRRIEMLVHSQPASERPRKNLGLVVLGTFLASLWLGQMAVAATFSDPVLETGTDPFEEVALYVDPQVDERQVLLGQLAQVQDELPLIGIHIGNLGPALASHLGGAAGELVLIVGVVPESPAAKSGLLRFDVLVRIDGRVASSESIASARRRLADGSLVQVEFFRAGRRMQATLGGEFMEVQSGMQRLPRDGTAEKIAGVRRQYAAIVDATRQRSLDAGDYAEALRSLSKYVLDARETGSDEYATYQGLLQRADSLLNRGDFAKSQRLLQEYLAVTPGRVQADSEALRRLARLAELYVGAGRVEAPDATLERQILELRDELESARSELADLKVRIDSLRRGGSSGR